MGIPVVATDAGGIPDIVEDGVTGLLTTARDPQALARAILRASLRGSREIVVPASNWGFVWLHGLFPRLLDWMMARFLRQRIQKV